MLKRHGFWLKTAIVFLILSAAMHSIALIGGLKGTTEAEKELIALMSSTAMETGDGFNPTMTELFTALSSCYTWLYLFGGLLFIVLLRTNASNNVLKAVTGLGAIIFGISLGVMIVYTFLPPIIVSALSFLPLAIAYFLIPKTEL